MSRTNNDLGRRLRTKFVEVCQRIMAADWSNPKNALMLIACIIMPFVAWQYISTGFILGLLLSISILWLLEKAPNFIKQLVCDYPLISDIVLSTLAVMLVGGYFGSGLVLGLGAAFATVILSWALPIFADKFSREQQNEATVSNQ